MFWINCICHFSWSKSACWLKNKFWYWQSCEKKWFNKTMQILLIQQDIFEQTLNAKITACSEPICLFCHLAFHNHISIFTYKDLLYYYFVFSTVWYIQYRHISQMSKKSNRARFADPSQQISNYGKQSVPLQCFQWHFLPWSLAFHGWF